MLKINRNRYNSITLTHFYQHFNRDREDEISEREYRKYFKVITDSIYKKLTSGKEYRLPYNLGNLYVFKKRQNINPIDYYNTKKYGKVIRHLNLHSEGLIYKLKWNKSKARFINKSVVKFTLSRKNKRELAKRIKEDNIQIVKIK